MVLTFRCPRCSQAQRSSPHAPGAALACENCGWTKPLPENAASPDFVPSQCLCCGNTDLWRQKDFPQWLGLSFVAAAAVLSSIAWYYHRPLLTIGILMAFALLDMVLYLLMGDVGVCYRCQARHHSADVSGMAGFNHELGERYRQERIRLETGARRTEARGDKPSPT